MAEVMKYDDFKEEGSENAVKVIMIPSTWMSLPHTCKRVATQKVVYSILSFCTCTYSVPYILRPPIQAEKCGLKLKVVLKWRNIYIGNGRS